MDLDSLIAFIAVLFLLSVIAEKFSQLVRQNTKQFAFLTLAIGLYCVFGLLRELPFSHDIGLLWLNWVMIIAIIFYLSHVAYKGIIWLRDKSEAIDIGVITILLWPIILALVLYYFFLFQLVSSVYYFLGTILIYLSLVALKVIRPLTVNVKDQEYEIRLFDRIKKGFSNDKNAKEREVSILTILIGVFIAFCFKINLFELANRMNEGDKALNLGWGEYFPFFFEENRFRFEGYEFDGEFTLSILLTGFFLSFGSKFFHDLLDRLYLAKKIKEASASEKLLTQGSADAMIRFAQNFDADQFYESNAAKLVEEGLVGGMAVGSIIHNNQLKKGVKIFNSGPNLNPKVLQFLHSQDSKGKLSKIPFEIIPTNTNKPANLTGVGFTGALQNQTTGGGGQVTFPVINTEDFGNNFFLSCYHTIKHPDHSWTSFVPGSSNSTVVQNSTQVGTIVAARRTSRYEAALIKQLEGQNFDIPFPDGLHKIKDVRQVTAADEGLEVFAYSRRENQEVSGTILNPKCVFQIKFGGRKFTMVDLICIKGPNGHIQRRGDSGGVLYDGNGFAIGILFARKVNEFSFAMNLQNVLNDFKLIIKT